MGISIPKIITIDEFKGSEIYDIALGDDTVAYSDNFILEAISMATMNMDQLSGFQLMKNIDTLEQSDLDYVKFGACKYVNHLLRKGPEYLRGSGASTLGGANFSQTNPDDPYYIPPEVWTALQKVNMLADFVVGNFKTPATANSGFSYTTRGDKFFEDGNFAVTVREGNAWYVRYDRVQSSDNTVKISLGNDVDRKVLNITLNADEIIGVLENKTSFKNIVLSATMKNIDKIIDAVFSQIIKDEGLIALITTSSENIILDDEKFKIVLENAIEKLLTNDSNFLTNVEEKLKGDLVFTTEIGRIMASNESIINAITANQDLIDTISNGVKEQMTDMLKDTYVDLVDTTPIEGLGGKSVSSAINSILPALYDIKYFNDILDVEEGNYVAENTYVEVAGYDIYIVSLAVQYGDKFEPICTCVLKSGMQQRRLNHAAQTQATIFIPDNAESLDMEIRNITSKNHIKNVSVDVIAIRKRKL
jgi:hypothetical protein